MTGIYGSVMDHETCEQCGFDGARFDDDGLLAAVRALGPTWRGLLAEAGDHLRTRPAPEVWSALEYGAHSRDITALHAFGVEHALTNDEPVLPPLDGDALIDSAASTYDTEDVADVLARLDAETQRLADNALIDRDWERGLTVGTDRHTVRRMLEHALHDSLHHVDDVQRGLRQLQN
jgi:hypothetical protein